MKKLLPVFFLSGFAALIFETIWFYQLRLSLGNSVWATGMTLTAFMTGLALGNYLVTRRAKKPRKLSAVKTYAVLEVLIGGFGIGLVFLLPAIQDHLLSVLSALGNSQITNVVRLGMSFGLLVIPATCMGATLPLLVGAMTDRAEDFGRVLGFFYAANTAGAVIGVVAAEWVLIGSLQIFGAAAVAAAANLLAAILAVVLATSTVDESREPTRFRFHDGMFIGATCGFSLLALEVIWFRYLSLYLSNTSQIFAVMLGVVLVGISAGGAVGGRISERANAYIAPALMLCGFATLFLFEFHSAKDYRDVAMVVFCAASLMLPVSFLSGVLFSLVGTSIHREMPNATQASGWLTVFNTLGSALGAFLATFVLLPTLGSYYSVALIGLLYGLVGVWSWRRRSEVADRKLVRFAAVALLVACIAFPFHDPISQFVDNQELAYDAKVIGAREGLTETGVLIEHPFLGQRHSVSLITNGYAMSGNQWGARRYMKQYVYLPVALMGELDRALLICFGVGSTAKALVESPEIKTVDVVDISSDVFTLSDKIFAPAEHPLRDPRANFHVEDGRHFLATTDKTYDLITAEPPPPAVAGVVTLYTREFFELTRDRLNDEGMVTYWLPLFGLRQGAGASVVKAFCEVFSDCSLWSGMGDNLMMVGTKDRRSPASVETFVQQWDGARLEELQAVGYEHPFLLSATFIADASTLEKQLDGVKPVVDSDPHRILDSKLDPSRWKTIYKDWVGVTAAVARERFEKSETIDRLMTSELQRQTTRWFDEHERIAHISAAGTLPTYDLPHGKTVENFLWAVFHDQLEKPALWTFDSDADYARILRDVEKPDSDAGKFHLAVTQTRAAFRTGQFQDVDALFRAVDCASDFGKRATQVRAIMAAIDGDQDQAQKLADSGTDCRGRRLVVDLQDWLNKSK